MKCDKCGKDAVIELVIYNGLEQVRKRFCQEHYLEFLEEHSGNLVQMPADSMKKMMEELLQSLTLPQEMDKEFNIQPCPSCGTSLLDILDSWTLGCEDCLKTFKKPYEDFLFEKEGNFDYRGKFPRRFKDLEEKRNELHHLEKELKEVVREERFEEAVVLRDRIREIQRSKEQAYE